MKAFAELIERLAFEPRRTGKITLMRAYFRTTPDPDRGYALAVLCGTLDIPAAKPAMLKALIAERTDPVLFALAYDFVGDLSETIALMWPGGARAPVPEGLGAIAERLARASRSDVPHLIAGWLDALDEPGRWALIKLMTGALRIGVSAALAKQAVAELGGVPPGEIEEVWHALAPPYSSLFAWLEGRGARPDPAGAATFRSVMLAHPLDEADLEGLDPADFAAEWKWDGIRIQAVSRAGGAGRLFSRSGDDITAAFPDLAGALAVDAVIDGELVIVQEDGIAPFWAVQQRLNRKQVSARQIRDYPAHLVAYDLLFEGTRDLRAAPFDERRARLETLATIAGDRVRVSPLITFSTWEDLAEQRAATSGNAAIEGVMLKRRASPYLAGRPKGLWFKWKRDPGLVDCVMMYAQRGHGRRSSYYSDFTFGVWDGAVLVPVGKAYSGFTDAELVELDRFVRRNTANRFGPVREVRHEQDAGLVLEIAYEGLQESTRHKSGLAMRFPRINRIRWDKRPAEADRIETLRLQLGESAARSGGAASLPRASGE
jgi:DNA ligase-1